MEWPRLPLPLLEFTINKPKIIFEVVPETKDFNLDNLQPTVFNCMLVSQKVLQPYFVGLRTCSS